MPGGRSRNPKALVVLYGNVEPLLNNLSRFLGNERGLPERLYEVLDLQSIPRPVLYEVYVIPPGRILTAFGEGRPPVPAEGGVLLMWRDMNF